MRSWKRSAHRPMAVLLGCLVLAPPGVWAQEKAGGKVRNYVVSARRLYEDLEYERALEQLSRAKRFSRTEADDVLLSLYEGLILADLGKKDEANAAFKAALFLQPDAKLPLKVSPKVQQQFEAAREQVRRELAKQEPPPVAQVKPAEPPPAPVPVKPAQDAPVAAVQPKPVELKPAPQAAAAPVEVSGERSLRSRAWVPAAAGGVLLVAGAGLFVMAKSEQSKLRSDDASLATEADVDGAVSRGRTFQTVGLGLAGAGVVGLGVAAGMYLLGASPEPEKVGLGVGTDGTSAFVYGRWP